MERGGIGARSLRIHLRGRNSLKETLENTADISLEYRNSEESRDCRISNVTSVTRTTLSLRVDDPLIEKVAYEPQQMRCCVSGISSHARKGSACGEVFESLIWCTVSQIR